MSNCRPISRVLAVALCFALATPAFAQVDDDLLSPLTPKGPSKPKTKPKPKPKPAVKPVKPPRPEPEVDLAPLVPIKGDLLVQLSSPARNAKLFVDSQEQGGFPSKVLELNAGEHTVQVKAPGFATWNSKVNVPANKTTEHKVNLTAISALLSVSSDVAGAEVMVNGRVVGVAPVTDLEVPAGTAELVVRKDGHQSAAQTVRLINGKSTDVTVRLEGGAVTNIAAAQIAGDAPYNNSLTPNEVNSGPMDSVVSQDDPPIYQRWYFWAGVGVVAAAAVIGTVVGVSASQPAQPLGPKGICGPDGCNQCLHCAATGLVQF